MGTVTIALKLTPAEKDVLDWLSAYLGSPNQSQTIREAVIQMACLHGLHGGPVYEAWAEREKRPARNRSGRVANGKAKPRLSGAYSDDAVPETRKIGGRRK